MGDTFEKGQEFGTLESTKSVSPLFMPVAGTIKAFCYAAGEQVADGAALVEFEGDA